MARRRLVHHLPCFVCGPVGGPQRPEGIQIAYVWDDVSRILDAQCRFGSECQGAPGYAHGGSVFAVLDEALGGACWMSGLPVLTGRITIQYSRPVPLQLPCRVQGQVVDIAGRKVTARGQLFGPDGLCAEAEGLFIQQDRFAWNVELGEIVD